LLRRPLERRLRPLRVIARPSTGRRSASRRPRHRRSRGSHHRSRASSSRGDPDGEPAPTQRTQSGNGVKPFVDGGAR
jgi:hypothetical protein